MNEKRIYQRSAIELAASYGIPNEPQINREAKIRNISAGGFSFMSQEKLKVGKEIRLEVDLEQGEPLLIPVRVVWCNKDKETNNYSIGVQIIESKGNDSEKFIEFYTKQLHRQM